MGAVYFYHLTRRPLEQVLPMLLDRSLGQGWRVLVRGRNPRALEHLDKRLWAAGDPASFLPHGIGGGPHDAEQPVLLTLETDAMGRECVISIEGAEITPEEITAAERACIIFDGMDGAALDRARSQWRTLTKAGVAAQYWSEESGNWEKKAETPAE